MTGEVDTAETGALGVLHLKRLWWKHAAGGVATLDPAACSAEWPRDVAVVDGLGVGLEPALRYLATERPSYAEFERWILAANGGDIHAARRERLNAMLGGPQPGECGPCPPVLEPADLAFWDEHGYVVVVGAVEPTAARAAAQAVWDHVGAQQQHPATWYARTSVWVPLYRHVALDRNRVARRVHGAFAQLWGRHDLLASIDQAGFNPPETSAWRFPGPDLHWDVDLRSPISFGTQGILYLEDCAPEQGAFTCVAGFHRRLGSWLASLPPGTDPQRGALNALGARPVPGRAGDLVIWHHALPHGSSPNRGQRPRVVQYVNHYPVDRRRQA